MSFTNTFVNIYPYNHPGAPPERLAPPPKCTHDRLRFVWRIFRGKDQTKRYGFQCVACGDSGWKTRSGTMVSQFVADRNCWEYFGEDYRTAQSYHDVLTDDLANARREFYDLRYQIKAERTEAWWDWYNKYLQCDAWKAMRQEVFARDGHKCRACSAPAEQVHHLTYERVGYELLDDLVSICVRCHESVHR